MKTLTQSEYDALGDGPHDARLVGYPPTDVRVLLWADWFGWVAAEAWTDQWFAEGPVYDFEKYPIWHKLPADYAGPK